MRSMLHVVAGYPTLAASRKVLARLVAVADFVEVQIPFSDPSADGPTITAANEVALRGGVTARETLALVAEAAARKPKAALLVMCYVNTVLAFKGGSEGFFAAVAASGARGVIIPDVPLEEISPFRAAAQKAGVAIVPVIAPNTTPERMRQLVAGASPAFPVYLAARSGVTGGKTRITRALSEQIADIRRATEAPIAVGFGIQTGADVRALKRAGADIAVVGSALLRAEAEGALDALLDELSAALR